MPKIEAEKIKQIRKEVVAVFGARTVCSQSASYQGAWEYGVVDFTEDIIRLKSLPAPDRRLKGLNVIQGKSEAASPAGGCLDHRAEHPYDLIRIGVR